MKLFELTEDYKVKLSEEAFTLIPFKKIIDKDKTKNKSKAIKELSYVYFFTDYRSIFANEVDEKKRTEEIRKHVGLPEDWVPDETVKEAIQFYRERQESISLKLLRHAYKAVEKISQYFDSVDLTEHDKSGKPKYNAKQLAETIEKVGPIYEALKKVQLQVEKDQQEAAQLRGGREKGMYADE